MDKKLTFDECVTDCYEQIEKNREKCFASYDNIKRIKLNHNK